MPLSRPRSEHAFEARPRLALTRRAPCRLLIAAVLLGVLPQVAAGQEESVAPPSSESAIHVRAGGVNRSQVIALGRDLWVEGRVLRDASVLRGDAFIDGVVVGDVVVLNGSIYVRPGGEVGGDAIALGGRVIAGDDAVIGGRTLSYPGASGAVLALLEVPQLGGRATVLSAKIGLLLAWWLAGVLLLLTFGKAVKRSAQQVRQPMESFWTGLTFLLATGLGLTLLAGIAPALITLPLAVLLAVVALVLKIIGTVCVVYSFGGFLLNLAGRDRPDDLSRFLIGLSIIGGVKLVPWVGALVWSALTLVGMGAVLREWVRADRGEQASLVT